MNQLKVFEFAKEIGVETLVLMDKIREWKLPVRSHMATLDEAMMSEIKSRLDESGSSDAAKGKKKTVRKKVAPEATVAAGPVRATPSKTAVVKKEAAAVVSAKTTVKATPSAPAKKTVVKKPTTKASVAAAAAAELEKSAPARSTVIRRKAGEAELKAEAAAAAAAAEAALLEAAALQSAEVGGENLEATGSIVVPGVVGAVDAPRPEEPARRRNIVGRMDLRRVANIPSNTSGAAGAGAAGQARPSRTAPRNIRPGFFPAENSAPAPAFPPTDGRVDVRGGDDKNKKRPGVGGSGGGREEEVKIFTATEFRKREVIFQPKKKKVISGRDAKKTQLTTPAAHKRIVRVDSTISLQSLASELGVKVPALMKKLIAEGVQAGIHTELDFDTVALIVPEFGFEAQNTHRSEAELLTSTAFGDMLAAPVLRPPVVTVMGHVDHGKTTLLDAIRNARVAAGEAGGITQHIGAYSVDLETGQKVTFIDTPGHEAFTAMRARGANVTDIAIIVVAADDGMMPQTAEAINHAKAAKVPIIVAVNKMDKPGANPDKIKQQLTEFELVPEEWGGTTIYCPVSALKGTGIKELLEQIVLVAEMAELKANPKRSGTGIVIESRMEKGRGCVATLLVQDGTVGVGQVIVAGAVPGRVRSMLDDKGKNVKEIGPGMPVEILGLPMTPVAGDRFDIVPDDEAARRIAQQRVVAIKQEEMPHSKMSLDQLFARVKSGDVKELALVLKADVSGSLEAVKGMLDKIGNEEVKLKLIHSAVGGITESDVLLCGSARGVVVGFNVRPDAGATRMAKEKGVEIKSYSIIYELVDELKKALVGLLSPDVVEKSMARAEVRNVFTVPKMGTIAGCFITEGKITRNYMLRLVRDSKIVYEGKVGSLKRFKDDVKEVASGFECGIGIENFNDIKVGDVIEAFVKEEQAREI